MKKGKSILTRCLALALALVLIVSSANLGAALKVSANSETVVTVGELVAKNYELAAWVLSDFSKEEEKLLGPALEDAADAALLLVDQGIEAASAKYNGRKP